MEAKRKVPFHLLIVGALLMSAPYILKRYMLLGDTVDGVLRGIGIGLLVVALFVALGQGMSARKPAN